MYYINSELDKFINNLEKIIDCIEKSCIDLVDENDILIIINKLHFYAQDFFVNNELALRENSELLKKIKSANREFFSGLKSVEIMNAPDKNIGLNNLKIYIQGWIEKNTKINA
ncbi:MAG: hypothetical protein JXR68_02990 [Bacteroidales bacterium]|nr:hypothetical protein [Bacteroidales bacterium]